jgi:hypothetical protein
MHRLANGRNRRRLIYTSPDKTLSAKVSLMA